MTASDSTSPAARFRLLFAAVWLPAFFAFFFHFTLPNSNPPVSRVDLWFALPDVFLGVVSSAPEKQGMPTGWEFFPQRFDLLAVAAFVLISACALGRLTMRLLPWGSELTRVEAVVLSAGCGLSLLTLLTLGCGLAGFLNRPFLGCAMLAALLAEAALRFRNRRTGESQPGGTPAVDSAPLPAGWKWTFAAVMFPFLLATLLGAMLPSVDFDVKEYHLQGPKEYFQNGRVEFLPHNVYTSFPFLTEMLTLLSMVLRDDWFRGALAGKAVLAGFAPLTALAVFAIGRRWFGETAAWLGALIFLTTPWTYRISIIAYAEGGLTFFLAAAAMTALIAAKRNPDPAISESTAGKRTLPENWRGVLCAGFLAGSGMACKYPGVVQVVIPLGAFLAIAAWKFGRDSRRESADQSTARTVATSAAVFALGTIVAVGPWLLKNAVETGNPVYPLLYSVFGGRDWDPDLNAKWRAGHSPATYAVSDLAEKVVDVAAKSDWLSPLLFGFAPLAFLRLRRDDLRPAGMRASTLLWIFAAYLFAAWWLLTHRIDRFWIPMVPVVAVLAGAGAAWSRHRLWQAVAGAAIATAVLFNLGFILTPLCGYNAYLADLDAARRQTAEISAPGMVWVNRLPEDATVLCVGEAQVFDARRRVVYNTVFDRSLFREWFGEEAPGVAPEVQPLKSPEEIRRTLREAGVTHVFVNWQEVLRYRQTYGYTKFVAPSRFDELQRTGVLGPPLFANDRLQFADWSKLSPSARRELQSWAPELIDPTGNRKAWVRFQMFPVVGAGNG